MAINTSVERLLISDNHAGGRGAEAIAAMMHEKKNLVELDISTNQMQSHGINALADAIPLSQKLTSLDLSENLLVDRDACALVGGLLENTSIKRLYLQRNDFGGSSFFIPFRASPTFLFRKNP